MQIYTFMSNKENRPVLTSNLFANEMTVQFCLRDQEVELSSLATRFTHLLFNAQLLDRLFLSLLAHLTFLTFVALPEEQHLLVSLSSSLMNLFTGLYRSRRRLPGLSLAQLSNL